MAALQSSSLSFHNPQNAQSAKLFAIVFQSDQRGTAVTSSTRSARTRTPDSRHLIHTTSLFVLTSSICIVHLAIVLCKASQHRCCHVVVVKLSLRLHRISAITLVTVFPAGLLCAATRRKLMRTGRVTIHNMHIIKDMNLQ